MAAALHQPKHRRPQARHLFTARVFTARRQPDAVKRPVTGERSVIGPPTCIGELEISREVSLINDDYRSFISREGLQRRGELERCRLLRRRRVGSAARSSRLRSGALLRRLRVEPYQPSPSLRLCSRTPSSSSAACSAASTLAACGASSCDTTNSATSCEKPPEEFSTTVQH